MQQEFGEARVFSAPIAEDYIVGTANGMSRFDPKNPCGDRGSGVCRLFLACRRTICGMYP